MESTLTKSEQKKGYISNSTLTLVAIATTFFPRVLISLKIPSLINFLHFAAVPLACGSTLLKSRSKDPRQIATARSILIGLFLLLGTIFASALLNDAGFINAVLSFLLLAEPFMLLLTIVSLPLTAENFIRFRTLIIRFALTNIIFTYIQRYVFQRHKLPGLEDNITGVFIGQGAGHVISSSISLTFAVYYFVGMKSQPIWLRGLIVLIIFNQVIISDTKQVLLSFIVGYMLLHLINIKNPAKTLIYLIAGSCFIGIFLWAIYNFEFLSGFTTWIRPEIYGPDGEATRLKFAAFRIAPQYFTSPLNWLFGLGPGHTVGRLGGWMLEIYWDLLKPLDATVHPVSVLVWRAVGESWLGNQSSMFSPLFGWAGIWGDLGFVGLGVYFYLGFLIWNYVCLGEIAKYLVLTIFVFGCIFSQLEEPSYMLFVVAIIGLQWHEHRNKNLV
ncbi:hypothetical protein BST81_25620 [Leptolyngbya sp. 'hensonii']|uniref:hypothetical protein n=1 Tax=Leptolyngbya sp. 'hensonii' TaxID=1922337 RepID=UPI00094F591C|nr:hypothetical protein [Leptolyngbya sp. 'hensonii']OLP15534.1 hypothetical protein BST81_25620 [Leptolyngbya sp. 'hensonii']